MTGAYIGPLGGLVEIAHYKGSVSASSSRSASFTPLLGGGRVGFLPPNRGLREWSVSASFVDPSQYTPFELMLTHGDGPFWWVDPLAKVTNVLTPRMSMFQTGVTGGTSSVGGAFTAADGTNFPVSLVATAGNVYIGQDTPVIPGVKVTGSMYATLGTKMHLHIRDAAGAILENISVNSGVDKSRLSLTATAPAGAASARLVVAADAGAGTVAGPAVTWTPSVTPWSVGRAARAVVVHGLSDEVTRASVSKQYKSLSFTVTEVGAGA